MQRTEQKLIRRIMQRISSAILRRSELSKRYLSGEKIWRPPLKKGPVTAYAAVLVFLILFTAVCMLSLSINTSTFTINKSINKTTVLPSKIIRTRVSIPTAISDHVKEYPLFCSVRNQTQTCPTNYPTKLYKLKSNETQTCPDYFRWIHEDLRPWKASGISRDMVERAKGTAHFRLVIVHGKAYIEKYKKSIQTRDVFTIWGILQLLRRYPGMIPDLELMFDCDDKPVIHSREYRRPNSGGPPALFRYCGDRWTDDIVFPDWSFWGWAEINIKPWELLLKELKHGNDRSKWIDRVPYAYWKGNPHVADTRKDLLRCNVSETQDWNARLFQQDWIQESQQGFKQSELAGQCTYRYKIYIEGYAWSVSEKYILACNSMTLLVKPTYYDFFLRSLQPTRHYWPIRDDDKCKSIKYAVDWGNNNTQQAQAIGKAASDFIQNDLKMDYVYDYIFHLLNEYGKLLRFEPKVPEGATELCSENMACTRDGSEKKFMEESMVRRPSTTQPCKLPPPFDPKVLRDFYRDKINLMRRVEKRESTFWENRKQ